MPEILKIREDGKGVDSIDAHANRLFEEKFGHNKSTLEKIKQAFKDKVASLTATLSDTNYNSITLIEKRGAKQTISDINNKAEDLNKPEKLIEFAKKIFPDTILMDNELKVGSDGKVSLVPKIQNTPPKTQGSYNRKDNEDMFTGSIRDAALKQSMEFAQAVPETAYGPETKKLLSILNDDGTIIGYTGTITNNQFRLFKNGVETRDIPNISGLPGMVRRSQQELSNITAQK